MYVLIHIYLLFLLSYDLINLLFVAPIETTLIQDLLYAKNKNKSRMKLTKNNSFIFLHHCTHILLVMI